MIQGYTCAWIGLFRDSWTWSDQTSTSSSLRWAEKQPDNLSVNEICAAVDEDGRISDELCSRRFFFFCKSPPLVKRQILRLEVKAGNNVNDQVTADAVLKEVSIIYHHTCPEETQRAGNGSGCEVIMAKAAERNAVPNIEKGSL
ncbi:hypothetical protein cypCar_00020544 [Cyprinus carpio]|nr:hypothetical protein cypCar_00020544 [Cyprinus carpio]